MRRTPAASIFLDLFFLVSCGGATTPVRYSPGQDDVVDDRPLVRRLDNAGWVEVRTMLVAPGEEAPARARARALARARAAACEFVSGVTVRSAVLSFQAVREQEAVDLVQTLNSEFAEAVVVDERVVSDTFSPLTRGEGFRLDLVMRARVVDRRGPGADPGFTVEVRVPREHLLEDEEVTIEVRASRAARLYVINLTEDGLTVLLPNEYEPDPMAVPGEWTRFPGPELHRRGVRVIARLPTGRTSAAESLLVVALRGDRRLSDCLPGPGRVFRAGDASGSGRLLYDLLSPLAGIPPSDWAIGQAAYVVLHR